MSASDDEGDPVPGGATGSTQGQADSNAGNAANGSTSPQVGNTSGLSFPGGETGFAPNNIGGNSGIS